jgi:hypothetical protein
MDAVKTSVAEQQELCDDVIALAKTMASGKGKAADSSAEATKIAMSFVKMKRMNRDIYLSLEAKRKDVELHRDKVDKLHLDLENLLYKEAHLLREISLCKDLSTPNTQTIEDEINMKLASTDFTQELNNVHEESLALLDKEMSARQKMMEESQALSQTHQHATDKLDKKRKFLDELPTRISTVKTATTDLQNQFNTALQDVRNNSS